MVVCSDSWIQKEVDSTVKETGRRDEKKETRRGRGL